VFHIVLLCYFTDGFYLSNCCIVNLERKLYETEAGFATNLHLEYWDFGLTFDPKDRGRGFQAL